MRIIILALLLTGCAAREISSTDDHHRITRPDCSLVRVNNSMHTLCCMGERCWLAE